jgi:predicted transglutaminase-like cysteine proteinase
MRKFLAPSGLRYHLPGQGKRHEAIQSRDLALHLGPKACGWSAPHLDAAFQGHLLEVADQDVEPNLPTAGHRQDDPFHLPDILPDLHSLALDGVDSGAPFESRSVTSLGATGQTLTRVNQQVNAAIKAKTDKDHWGVEDTWDFAEDGYGDCEDYQLVKRKRLVEAGFPRRALRMTVVIDEEGAGHAVMMVRTTRGDFILDNKCNSILPWHRTGYVYITREGDEGSAWASLGGRTSPIMTANQ